MRFVRRSNGHHAHRPADPHAGLRRLHGRCDGSSRMTDNLAQDHQIIRRMWCGSCHRTTRLTADGHRCKTCNPLAGRDEDPLERRPWCGQCEKSNRRVVTVNGSDRCRRCHPLGRPPMQWPMRDVPEGLAEQLLACEWLCYISPLLRAVGVENLRELLRRWFAAGWTPRDVVYGLDNLPTGGPHPGQSPEGRIKQPLAVSFVKRRLGAWLDGDDPLPSVSEQIWSNRDAVLQRQEARRARLAEEARLVVDPRQSVSAEQARIIARRAACSAATLRREADAREQDRIQADLAARNQAVSDWARRLLGDGDDDASAGAGVSA
jgi:hypothetical protein